MVQTVALRHEWVPDLFQRRTGKDGDGYTYYVIDEYDGYQEACADEQTRVNAYDGRKHAGILQDDGQFDQKDRGRVEDVAYVEPLRRLQAGDVEQVHRQDSTFRNRMKSLSWRFH